MDSNIKNKTTSIYVSPHGSDNNDGSIDHPFATVEKARDVIRSMNRFMDRDLTVYLRGGEYNISATIELDERDSATNGYRIIYRNYPGEKPVLSGATRVTGWTEERGIFKTTVGAGTKLRELFVNGTRARRARSESFKIIGWDEDMQTFKTSGSAVAGWTRLDPDLEVVILQHWVLNYFRLGSWDADKEGNVCISVEPAGKRNEFFNDPYPARDIDLGVHFENSLQYLKKPGDWCLVKSTGDLYYIPRPGETLRELNAVTPGIETMIKLSGADESHRISNITIKGLTFEYTKWQASIDEDGVIPQQADMTEFREVNRPSALLYMDCAENLIIERNVLRHTANAGIDIHSRSVNNEIRGNVLTDIGSNGIQEGLFNEAGAMALSVQGNKIRNNYLKGISVTSSGVGIASGYTNGVVIENNEISDCTYTGISVGWGWTTEPTCLGNNRIRCNHIYHVVNKLSDGGGIYTLSRQPGSEIACNYIHDIDRSEWCGASAAATIYLDQGSQGIRVSDNVFKRVGQTLNGSSMFYPSNTLINNESQDQAIINGAGLEPEYMDIIPDTHISGFREWQCPERCSAIISGIVMPQQAGLPLTLAILKNTGVIWEEKADSMTGLSYHMNIDLEEGDIISFTAKSGEHPADSLVSWFYRISILEYPPLLNIDSIVFPSCQIGKADVDFFSKRIAVRVSENTDVTSLACVIRTPPGTVLEAASEKPRDFSDTVVYTVQMEEGSKYTDFDGSRKYKNWKVAVLKEQPVTDIKGYSLRHAIMDAGNWFVSGGTKTMSTDGLQFTNNYAIYQGKTFTDEIFEFKLGLNATDWPSILLRNKYKDSGLLSEGNEAYLITIKDTGVELQRFNGGARTVFYGNTGSMPSLYGDAIPNLYFDYQKDNLVQVGAVNVGQDVRLLLYINGRKVFDCIDQAKGKITSPGYFGTYQTGDASYLNLSINQNSQTVLLTGE